MLWSTADDCDVLIASFGANMEAYLATEVPAEARRYAASVDAAIARGRCPTRPVRLCDLGEPPNCVPRLATRFADVELRSDDLFLMDRFLYVVVVLGNALIHGRTDQFDSQPRLPRPLPALPGRPVLVPWSQRRAQGRRRRRPRRARS